MLERETGVLALTVYARIHETAESLPDLRSTT